MADSDMATPKASRATKTEIDFETLFKPGYQTEAVTDGVQQRAKAASRVEILSKSHLKRTSEEAGPLAKKARTTTAKTARVEQELKGEVKEAKKDTQMVAAPGIVAGGGGAAGKELKGQTKEAKKDTQMVAACGAVAGGGSAAGKAQKPTRKGTEPKDGEVAEDGWVYNKELKTWFPATGVHVEGDAPWFCNRCSLKRPQTHDKFWVDKNDDRMQPKLMDRKCIKCLMRDWHRGHWILPARPS
jgi:hypothetical protein